MRTLKRIIRSIFHPLAVRLGYQLIPVKSEKAAAPPAHHKNTLLRTFYSVLKDAGFEPQHIVDVGANHGDWTRQALAMFPNARVTMLEPQSWLQPRFQDLLDKNPLVRFFPIGAGKSKGSFLFTITERDDSCTFRLSAEEANARGLEQKEIPVLTLNELISANGLPIPDLVKIDAEGLDLEVLEGASELMGHTEVFMVEAGIVNKAFANNLHDLVRYMDQKGYRLFDITDLNRPWAKRVLWLVELAFVRKGGKLDTMVWR